MGTMMSEMSRMLTELLMVPELVLLMSHMFARPEMHVLLSELLVVILRLPFMMMHLLSTIIMGREVSMVAVTIFYNLRTGILCSQD